MLLIALGQQKRLSVPALCPALPCPPLPRPPLSYALSTFMGALDLQDEAPSVVLSYKGDLVMVVFINNGVFF